MKDLKLVRLWLVLLAFVLFSGLSYGRNDIGSIPISTLPKQAQATLVLIKQGGPFPYDKDGAVFGNYEARLPRQKRGYYHEYTVKTPRARNRGARRIVAGGEPKSSGEYYYTDDHYESFRRIKE